MFFSKTKKIASELGPAIENTLKLPFLGSRYFDVSTGSFNPPLAFFDDPYIRGLVLGLIGNLGVVAFNTSSLSQTQRGRIVIYVWRYLADREEGMRISKEVTAEALRKDGADPEFRRGANDAGLLVCAAYGGEDFDDPDPIFQEAKKMAPNLSDSLTELVPGGSASSSLATAFAMLTLHKHIQDHFLDEDDDEELGES